MKGAKSLLRLRWYNRLLCQLQKDDIVSFSDRTHCLGGLKDMVIALCPMGFMDDVVVCV